MPVGLTVGTTVVGFGVGLEVGAGKMGALVGEAVIYFKIFKKLGLELKSRY